MLTRAVDRIAALRGWRRWLAAFLLGAGSALALPPLCAVPLLLVSIPGLLLLIGSAGRVRGALAVGFWFGFGQHVVGLYWLTDAILVKADQFWWLVPLADPGTAAALAVFIALPCGVAWFARPGWPRACALAGAWVVGDLARQFVLTGFPWNPLGSVWEFPGRLGDIFIQPAALFGVHGLTLVTLLLAATPALGRRARLLGGAVFLLWAGYGIVRATGSPAAVGKQYSPIAVALAQGDIDEGQKMDRAAALAIFGRYLRLTREGATDAAKAFPGLPVVVVWPETASPFLLDEDQNARAAIADAAGEGAIVLAGSVRFGPEGRPRNSLIAIGAGGTVLARYDKWHLVPFGEYQPSWADIGIQLVPAQGGFLPGPGPRTLHVPGLPPFSPLICYEAIFPGQVVDRADPPAWLVNITNDAWFGNSSGPRQHLAAARMRAVEQGLPLVRAANTGISAAFDWRGHEQARLGLGHVGVLVARVTPRQSTTPFARLGLIAPARLAFVALLLAFLFGNNVLFTGRFRRPSQKTDQHQVNGAIR
jgi:apolipoprotein N-acyltransferase